MSEEGVVRDRVVWRGPFRVVAPVWGVDEVEPSWKIAARAGGGRRFHMTAPEHDGKQLRAPKLTGALFHCDSSWFAPSPDFYRGADGCMVWAEGVDPLVQGGSMGPGWVWYGRRLLCDREVLVDDVLFIFLLVSGYLPEKMRALDGAIKTAVLPGGLMLDGKYFDKLHPALLHLSMAGEEDLIECCDCAMHLITGPPDDATSGLIR